MEWFDVYDEDMRHTGIRLRSDVHREGLWHQSFHCWLYRDIDGRRKLYIQLRHPDKDTFGGHYDISAAGHLSAGETVEQAVREIEEELGIRAAFKDLYELGTFRTENRTDRVWDREINRVYALESACDWKDFRLQPEEVTGLYLADLEELHSVLSGAQSDCRLDGIRLGPSGEVRSETVRAAKRDFVPREPPYYDSVFSQISKL